MHKLLQRQLRRSSRADSSSLPSELLGSIEQAYWQADEDRKFLEHTIEVTSRELLDRNDQLRQEVAERRRMGNELRESMSLLQATFESTADGLLVVGKDGLVSSFNQRLLDIWQVPSSALESQEMSRVIDFLAASGAAPQACHAVLSQLHEKPQMLELADGRRLECSSMPRWLEGVVAGHVLNFRDISERHRLQAQVRQSQKIDAIGQLAGGIAHDFNNLLTVITGFCEMFYEAKEPEVGKRHVGEIHQAAERAADLTRQLLAFSRNQMLTQEAIALDDTIGSLTGMLDRLLGDDVRVSFDLSAGTACVLMDSGQLQQIILNLVINARDAMPKGGEIAIATRQRWLADHGSDLFDHTLEAGQYLQLEVVDTGEGIPPEIQSRIFDPFFTTKSAGKGTGLGLATIYGIVDQCGGLIEVFSEPGQGTRFAVTLPAYRAEPKSNVESAVPSTLPSGKILVVEDDPMVRLIMTEIISSLDLNVVKADSPEAAIVAFCEDPESFEVLISDIMMPEMSGYDLAKILRGFQPQLNLLFVSGFVPQDPPADLQVRSIFLPKPFDRDSIRASLNQLCLADQGVAAARPSCL